MRCLFICLCAVLALAACELKEPGSGNSPLDACHMTCFTGEKVIYEGSAFGINFWDGGVMFTDKTSMQKIYTNGVCIQNYNTSK